MNTTLTERIRALTNASYQCTKDVERTYPAPQQYAERTAHLDWHRGYRAALRDIEREANGITQAMEKDMTAHTYDDSRTQQIEMYGVAVTLRQTQGFEVAVSFAGGTWPDGAEVRTFANMAAALVAVAEIAETLEEEEGDEWGTEL